MKNWIDLCSDVNWEDYYGMWGRKAKDGSWYILRWNNLIDAMGEREAPCKYQCDVLRVFLPDIASRHFISALESYSYKLISWSSDDNGEYTFVVREDHEDKKWNEARMIECLVQYGTSSPLESFDGDHYPLRIRAQARRAAESYMKDSDALDKALDRPVNKLGSTARDFGRGDSLAGLRRYENNGEHGTDPEKDLMLKLWGGSVRYVP